MKMKDGYVVCCRWHLHDIGSARSVLSLCGMLLSLTCYWSMRPSVPLEWVYATGCWVR